MKEADIRFAKLFVLVNAGVPLGLLAWDALHHKLGANPVKFSILTTGLLALIFLILTLVVTPLRKMTGWNWIIFSRRTLGLYAFFYASLHFLIFFSLDRSFSISGTLSEMVKRKYLLVGIAGLLAMVPLAVTSTNAMIKRLGGPRWRALHRLTYVAAIAGVIHYYMQTKADVRQPLAFAGVLALLLGVRLVPNRNRPTPESATTPTQPKRWSGQLKVVRITQETPDVRTFRLAPPEGGRLPFEHLPGQYLSLSLLIDGRKVNRTYTIASSPTQTNYCELTIKREDDGLASGHLHTVVREGDLLNISAPAGRFVFDGTQAGSVVLIAGGVGITPLMAILRFLTDKGWKGDIHFLYCARSPQDIIFRQELETLQKRHPNLRLIVTLTRTQGKEWPGRTGRIDRELLKQTIPDPAREPVFLCGPTSMMEPMTQLLRELGVPNDQIKSEAFLAAKRAVGTGISPTAEPASTPATAVAIAASPGGDPGVAKLIFARSGKTALLTPAKSLLELAEDSGLNLDFECRSGICGRCKARLVSGNVTMAVEDALDDADRADQLILLCQAKATESVTIEA